MSEAEQALLQRYMPLMIAEYERIGIAPEMERYFTGSGGTPITETLCDKWLADLRGIPSGIGFDAYCSIVGMNANEIRRLYDEMLQASHTPPDGQL